MEVMGAGEEGEGFGEEGAVELAGEMPDAGGEEGGEDGGGGEAVKVGFSGSGEAGVEVRGDFLGGEDADGGGEFGVEGGNPVVGVHGEVWWWVEVGDLAEGVDAGIGAAGAGESDFLVGFGDCGEGGFELVLDGVGVGLGLPTAVGGAVVGEGDFEAHGVVSWNSDW